MITCPVKGEEIERDDSLAFKYYYNTLAADQGDINAQCSLGWFYDNGRGVSKDESLAFSVLCGIFYVE